MAYKHGVYNTEQATSLTVPIQGSAGLQVIFGTAPIHLAKDPAAAVNTPKLVYSYKEAVEAVGYSDDFENFTLCQSINANGFKSWGNNTAAYPSTTDPKDRWWAVRRFFDWDGNNFIQTYFQKVDKPGNKRLIQSIVDSQNIIGNGYVARDYCAGYRVEFRSDENPVTNLLAGHLTVHTYLAPYIPAEYIENIREYDVDALESAIGGE